MAISQQYGMGTYNFRLPSTPSGISNIAGGVATPLAFFPSTRSGDVTESIDSSLQDLIGAAGGSEYTDQNTESTTATGTRAEGLGFSSTTGNVVGTVSRVGGTLAGLPAPVTSVVSDLMEAIATEGLDKATAAEIGLKGIVTAINPALVTAYNIGKKAAEKIGLMDIGAVFGPSDETLGYSPDKGITTFAAKLDAIETTVSDIDMTAYGVPATYTGPKADAGPSGGFNEGFSEGQSFAGGYAGETPETSYSDISAANESSSSSSSDKIVCTAMNAAYGFGSYRNAIWLRYSKKHMSPYHQTGYHAIFLPLVHRAYYTKKPSNMLKSILENIARHRTADLRAIMQGRRRDTLGCIYRNIFEPICYIVGFVKSKLTPLADK